MTKPYSLYRRAPAANAHPGAHTLSPVPTTPAKDRLARSKAALLTAGGRRMTVNLSPMATDALASIRMNSTELATDTLAIETAILNLWVKIKRSKQRSQA